MANANRTTQVLKELIWNELNFESLLLYLYKDHCGNKIIINMFMSTSYVVAKYTYTYIQSLYPSGKEIAPLVTMQLSIRNRYAEVSRNKYVAIYFKCYGNTEKF